MPVIYADPKYCGRFDSCTFNFAQRNELIASRRFAVCNMARSVSKTWETYVIGHNHCSGKSNWVSDFHQNYSMLPHIVKLSGNYKRFPMTVLIFCWFTQRFWFVVPEWVSLTQVGIDSGGFMYFFDFSY